MRSTAILGTHLRVLALLTAALALAHCAVFAGEPWDDGCMLAGRVVDAEGNPIPDAKVMFTNVNVVDSPTNQVRFWQCRADERGRFEFTGLPRGTAYVWCSKEGLMSPTRDGLLLAEPGQGERDIEIRMVPTGLVEGRVIDETGQPVAGATVDCITYVATTGEDGSFAAPSQAMSHARASAPGYAAADLSSAQWRNGRFELTLTKGFRVSARVLDAATRRPLEGARIVRLGEETRGPGEPEVSKSDGSFTLEDLSSGRTLLFVTHDGLVAAHEIRVVDEDLNGIDVLLEKGVTISGRLLDEATGEPLAHVPVSATTQTRFAVQVKTDDEGRYVLSGLPPGEVGIAPGYRVRYVEGAPYVTRLLIGPGQIVAGVDFKISDPLAPSTAPRIVGRVVDEAGRPVQGAMLSFSEDGAADGMNWRNIIGVTDGAGKIVTPAERPSREETKLKTDTPYTVCVAHSEFATARLDDVVIPDDTKQKELKVVLKRGVTLHGKVLDGDGAPIPNATVFAVEHQPPGPQQDGGGPAGLMRIGGGPGAKRATTAKDGTYQLSGLSPGTWDVNAVHNECVSATLSAVVTVEADTAPPACNVTLTRLERGVIAGRVVDAEDTPVVGADVQAWSSSPMFVRRATRTDEDGRFRFDGVLTGEYRISANHPTLGRRAPPGPVPIGTTDVAIQLFPRHETEPPRWKLVDEEGRPIARFRIDRGHRSWPWIECYTDTGEFTASPQRNILVIEAPGYKTKSIRLDEPSESNEIITITMVKGDGALAERIRADGTRTVQTGGIVEHPLGSDGRAALAEGPASHRWVNDGGPHGGDIRAVALAASDPRVLYAATAGGVFKSTDAGETWQPTAPLRPEGRAGRPQDVAIDPTDPDVVYALDPKLFKSTDGGATWRAIAFAGGDEYGRVVQINRHDPATLYVCDNAAGVFKTTDGGETWQPVNKGLFNRNLVLIGLDEHDPQVLYGLGSGKSAVFVSRDAGATWEKAGGALDGITIKSFGRGRDDRGFRVTLLREEDDGGTSEHVCESDRTGRQWFVTQGGRSFMPKHLSIDKDDPNHLELSVADWSGGYELYLTTDGAGTWRIVDLPSGTGRPAAIAASRSTDGVLYASTRDEEFYFSDDGGETWEFFYSAQQDPQGDETAAVDELRACRLHEVPGMDYYRPRMAFHPSDPDLAYVADRSAGMRKTEDGGKTWTTVNSGIVAHQIWDIACHPTTPGLVYACGSSGIYKSTDGARSWQLISEAQPHTAPIAVHPHDGNILLAMTYRGVVEISLDAGETWRQIDAIPSREKPFSFSFDPENADLFCVMTKKTLYETTDRGQTWHASQAAVGAMTVYIRRPGPPGVVQPRTDMLYKIVERNEVWRSTDRGRTWESVTPQNVQTRIQSFHVHPADPRTVVAFLAGDELLTTRDGGETWRLAQLPERHWNPDSVGLDPKDPNTFYLGGCGQLETILRTRDGGKTFERLGNGLPGKAVTCITVSPADGVVYAGTDGFGVYRLAIEQQAEPDKSEE